MNFHDCLRFGPFLLLLSCSGGSLGDAPVLRKAPANGIAFGDPHRMIPLELRKFAVALADMDGDGDLDAWLQGDLGEPTQLENQGVGNFREVPFVGEPPFLGLLVDVDADGDLDSLIGTLVYEQVEPRTFVQHPPQDPMDLDGILGFGVENTGVGDVDGNGLPDLLRGGDGPNRLYLNVGGFAFVEASDQLPMRDARTRSVELGDLDGDGDLDAIVGNAGGRDQVYRNDGTGRFSNERLADDRFMTLRTDLGDVDGDGDLDVLLAARETIRIYLNDGGGTFSTFVELDGSPVRALETALVDVEGDGDPDVVSAGGIFVNVGQGVFTTSPETLPAGFFLTDSFSFGDVDGDGDADLLTSAVEGGNVRPTRLWLADERSAYTDSRSDLETIVRMSLFARSAAADVDGNGFLDVWIADDNPAAPNRLLLNTGTGSFVDGSAGILAKIRGNFDVVLTDLDRDGDPDAVLATQDVFENDGRGIFSLRDLVPDRKRAEAVAAGDIDADGDVDLAFVLAGRVEVYENDDVGGAGGLVLKSIVTFDATSSTFSTDHTEEAGLLDVDGDGDLDLVLAMDRHDASFDGSETGSAANRVFENDGLGAFSEKSSWGLGDVDATRTFAVADLDGDTIPDLLFGNGRRLIRSGLASSSGTLPDPNTTYLNQGDDLAPLPSFSHVSTFGLAVGDLDEDGDVDVVETSYTATIQVPLSAALQSEIFSNDGRGSLTSTGVVQTAGIGRPLVADFDGDGDLDVFDGSLRTNLLRQVAWSAPARLGKPFPIEVHGPARTPYTLLCAQAPGRSDEGPRGVLRLDASTTVVVERGVLDADGRATVLVDVPVHASLIGEAVYAQALVGAPPRYTNLEVSVLGDE